MDLAREALDYLTHAPVCPPDPVQVSGTVSTPDAVQTGCQRKLGQGKRVRGIERHPCRPAMPEPVGSKVGKVFNSHSALYPTEGHYNAAHDG